MNVASAFFQTLREKQSRAAVSLSRRYDQLALVRLVVFIGWLALMIVLISTDWRWGLAGLLVTTPLVVWGVRRHLAIAAAAAAAKVRTEIAERELAALDHDFSAFDGGKEFLKTGHPYALDLDLFGPHSLFQLLNRTVTAPGKARLARQLLAPLSQQERARAQVQGKELAAMPEWCTEFRTLGENLDDRPEYFTRLLAWLDRPAVVKPGLERIILPLSPLLTLAGLGWMLFMNPWQLGVIAFLPALYLIRKYKETAAAEHAFTAETGERLRGYARLLAHLDSLPPGTTGWPATAAGAPASKALTVLAYRISQLDVRYNPFVILLEVGGLWSLRWLHKLDQWREEYRADFPRWLEQLAAADAAVSWATLRFERPDWADAEFTDQPVVEATGLGHPLLPPNGRVTNDLNLRTDGHIHLVTGSNMAGKSTWLRTVGINLVLAQAGGPVCALHLRTRPLNVWTSMRTQDDLSESTSSFYAELKRLRSIIEAVADPAQHVFFLLDEILKGTNSRDRHTGSRALIRQLIRERGAGIIATHDLELGAMEAEPGSRVENFAMEVQVEGEELVFDYKLHPGVCQSFNATALMARMGIDIPEEEIRLHHD